MARGRRPIDINPEEVETLIRSGLSVQKAAEYLGTHRNTLYDRCKTDVALREAMNRGIANRPVNTNARPVRVPLHIKGLPRVVLEYLEAWAAREGRALNEQIVRQLTFACEIDVDCESSYPDGVLTGEEAEMWQDKFAPFTVMNAPSKEPES